MSAYRELGASRGPRAHVGKRGPTVGRVPEAAPVKRVTRTGIKRRKGSKSLPIEQGGYGA